MGRPEPPVGDAAPAQRRQPDVLDNQGQPVPVSPTLALDASQRVVQGKTCLGVTVRRAVPAPTPSSTRSNSVPADAPFRFSCTGKSTHVVQPPAKAGGKVVLPYCEGLEILAASSQAGDAVPRRDGVHGDAPVVPQRPPLGGLGPHTSPPAILDLTAFYERWKKSANKIAQRMQDNVNATLSLLTGSSRRG